MYHVDYQELLPKVVVPYAPPKGMTEVVLFLIDNEIVMCG